MATAVNDRLSARNQIRGTVAGLTAGQAVTHVVINVGETRLASIITNDAAKELDLKPNDRVVAVVKATEVMLMKGNADQIKISARNRIAGQVTDVQRGAAMGYVTIQAGSCSVSAAITREAIEDLQLNKGERVTAVFKATEVMLQKE
jgi:molybdate transport system regulatory protein